MGKQPNAQEIPRNTSNPTLRTSVILNEEQAIGPYAARLGKSPTKGVLAVLLKLKLVGLTGCLLIAATWIGMPTRPASACDAWTGPGLDDAPLQSLYSINAPLHGRDNSIDRSAAKALLDA